jgi:nucleoside-diphosphate-sugar epimerase
LSGAQLAASIRQHLPGFNMTYRPDRHQEIADTWPSSLDDSLARRDWNWDYEYGLSATTKDMLQHLGRTYSILS